MRVFDAGFTAVLQPCRSQKSARAAKQHVDGPAIPSAAKDLENGLTAAANPWGCPPPGGGCASLRAPRAVPQGVEDAGRRGGRVDDARNLGRRFCVHPSECSNAVVRGRRRAEPRAKPYYEMDINACCFTGIKASIRWPQPQNETRDKLIERANVAHCSGGFAEAVQLRRRYAVMKEAARARRR